MRPIPSVRFLLVLSAVAMLLALGAVTAHELGARLPLGSYEGMAQILLTGILFYAYLLFAYQVVLYCFPIREGRVREGTVGEWAYHIHVTLNLMVFYPLTRSNFIPVPFMRLLYILLGARIGSNTYPAGLIGDPQLTEIGKNCIIGERTILAAHNIAKGRAYYRKIRIGDNVTIAGGVIIGAGVVIEDGAVLSVGSLILPLARVQKNAFVEPHRVVKVGEKVAGPESSSVIDRSKFPDDSVQEKEVQARTKSVRIPTVRETALSP